MLYYLVKLAITTILIVAIAEISKRSSLIGGILASVPLVSVLAMIWLYVDTRDVDKIAALSTGIFWLVIPSLAMFVALPVLLKRGVNFPISLTLSILLTVIAYYAMLRVLAYFDITI